MSVLKLKRSLEEQDSVPLKGSFLKPGTLVDAPNPDMSLQDAILTRRTVRAYREEPVPFELFEELIGLSMHAPTACNEQRWKILYIDDPAIFEDLYERGSAAFVRKARQGFLALYNNHTDNTEYKDHIQSASAFITTFSLIAHSVGVGACWVGHLPNKRELQRLLGIHRYYEPVAFVTFGFYRSKVKTKTRKRDASDVISRNRFSREGLTFSTSKNVFLRKIARKLYYLIPSVFRRKLRPKSLPYEKKFYYEVYD